VVLLLGLREHLRHKAANKYSEFSLAASVSRVAARRLTFPARRGSDSGRKVAVKLMSLPSVGLLMGQP
jgi:hypothetical protein